MKKSILTCLSFIIIHSFAFAQSEDFPKQGVRLYLNYFSESYQMTSTNANFDLIREETNFQKIIPSFAYVWQKKEKRWSEIEVSMFLDFNKKQETIMPAIGGPLVTSGVQSNLSMFSLRYEQQYILVNNENILFSLGTSYQTYLLNSREIPMTSSSFPSTTQKYWLTFGTVPRLMYKFEKFAIDINTPLNLLETGFDFSRVDNPAIPIERRSSSGFSLDIFYFKNIFEARIGLLWYL